MAEEGYRSPTVTTVANNAGIRRQGVSTRYLAQPDMEISNGYGVYKDKAFRIAHMGEVNDDDMDRLFAAMDDLSRRDQNSTKSISPAPRARRDTMQHHIDLRSDTVTKPTPAMREAMAEAEVGDDVYGEDPTVNRLEALAAEMLGKEAAVFVPSGTMGNLISVLSHCGRGDEMILGDQAHIFMYEQGGAAAVGGVQPRTLPNRADGTLDLDQVVAAIRGDNEHYPVTRLMALENTQNLCGGRVLPVDYMDAAGELAHRHGLKLHVDGARIWNAAVALGVSPARLVQARRQRQCLPEQGAGGAGRLGGGRLGEFIRRARRMRKQVGGGMRQAGVLAAAALVALDEMVERLAEDHANARRLAEGLAALDGIGIEPESIQTNLVYFDVTAPGIDAAQLSGRLAARGVLMNPTGARRLRRGHQLSHLRRGCGGGRVSSGIRPARTGSRRRRRNRWYLPLIDRLKTRTVKTRSTPGGTKQYPAQCRHGGFFVPLCGLWVLVVVFLKFSVLPT